MANCSLRDRGVFNRTELGGSLPGWEGDEGGRCLDPILLPGCGHQNATYGLSLLISTCYRTRLLDYYPLDQERAWILGKR